MAGFGALLEAIINPALELERDSRPDAWRVATDQAIARFGINFTSTWKRLIPVSQALDAEAHEKARQARLAWKWPRVVKRVRRAPKVGEVIRIVVKRDVRAPPIL
jgi:hypothetical protein